jgi:DNA-binding transcriptional ArsR family regulator
MLWMTMMSSPHQDGEPLDLVLDALANPLRRSLIERLTERDINVGELSEGAGVSMPSISRHLRVLEKADLIVRLKHGRNHMISLRREPLRHALQWCAGIIGLSAAEEIQKLVFPDQTFEPTLEPVVTASHLELSELQQPEAQPEIVGQPDSIDLSPESLSDLVKRMKRG